ncbi:MAG: hypothetical protein F4X02_04125 [Chloroflexi bacterium]|nr:hypothetical protein [Chloroflexota bacterium]
MTTVRRILVAAKYALRIAHIALWMAIPTVLWHWLGSEPPAECVPQYGWYQGNVLCVSEYAHLWISFSLFLLGILVIACWIFGYSFGVVSRALKGEEQPPPLRMMSAVEGGGLFFMSLKYWLPMIANLIVITLLASGLPLVNRNHSYHVLLMMAAPLALVMYWGYIVGLARYAVSGEHTLLYQRRENMRLALSKVKATLALTGALFAAPVLGAFAWSILSIFLTGSRELDVMVVAALASFGFYFTLLCCSVVCSHLIARYAIEIGIG